MTDEVPRSEELNAVFEHLRRQDTAIEQLRIDVSPMIEVINNLAGFAQFCNRWGRRISKFSQVAAVTLIPLITLWQLVKEPLKQLLHIKSGGQ